VPSPAGPSDPPGPSAPPRRVLWALVVPIVLLTAAGALGNALLPTLSTHHPLLLIGLDARNRQLLLAAHRVGLTAFMVVAVVRKFASDPFFYGLGRLYRGAAVTFLERQSGRAARGVEFTERVFRRAALPLVALWSGSVVCTLAGATEMHPVTFVVVDIAGSVIEVYALWAVAGHLRGTLTEVTTWIAANQTWLTVLTATIVAALVVWDWRRGRTALALLEGLAPTDPADGPGRPSPQDDGTPT
jgi:membrane protein DedA with SNARE-associated domain